MAYVDDVIRVAVTGKWSVFEEATADTDTYGRAATGTVTIKQPLSLVFSESGEVVPPRTIEVDLDENGEISLNLPATNDPAVLPVGWAYEVSEVIEGKTIREYTLVVPYDTIGGLELALQDAPVVRQSYDVNYVIVTSLPPGEPGEDGIDGLTAYEVALANGFIGSEAEWLSSITGPAGEDGDVTQEALEVYVDEQHGDFGHPDIHPVYIIQPAVDENLLWARPSVADHKVCICIIRNHPWGVNEKKRVSVTGATSGTFTVTLDGVTSAPIAYNANGETVEAALEAMASIGAGNVHCTGGPLNTAQVVAEFKGALALTNLDTMTNTNSTDGTISTGTLVHGEDFGIQPDDHIIKHGDVDWSVSPTD